MASERQLSKFDLSSIGLMDKLAGNHFNQSIVRHQEENGVSSKTKTSVIPRTNQSTIMAR